MSTQAGYLIMFSFWAIGFLAIRAWGGKKAITGVLFLLSNRKVGFILGAVSVATAWVWAPALFVASQKAYEQGLPGLFWFTFPNMMALVLFSFLATKAKSVFPRGFTLPELMRVRFGKKVQLIYMATILLIQVYSVILQVTAALLMLNLVTGIDKSILVLILGSIILSLSLTAGFRSSLTVDVVKALFILIVGLLVCPWVIGKSGGFQNVVRGLGGITGDFGNLFDTKVAFSFGIPISVSLLSGIVVDQQQWQRAFAMRKEVVRKSFLFAAVLFLMAPIILGIFGFAAAGSGVQVGRGQAQLAGVFLVKNYLPQIGTIIFTFMVLAGLAAAGVAALSAAGSVGAVDFIRFFKRDLRDKHVVLISRVTMVIVLTIGLVIALIPEIQILYLVLLVGVFRASLMVPTILSLYWSSLSPNYTFAGIVFGMLVGVPLFVYGSLHNISTISAFGSLAPIMISMVFCIFGAKFKPSNFHYEKLEKVSAIS